MRPPRPWLSLLAKWRSDYIMRVYELAAKIGTTSQTVMRLAGENDVEVYSPLSSLESEDVETLNAAFRKIGAERLKAEAVSARDRRLNKARRALKAAAATPCKDVAVRFWGEKIS
jgi:hypothetical protein